MGLFRYFKKLDLGISYFELMISRIIGSGEKWSILFFKDIPGFYFPLSVRRLALRVPRR